MTLNLMKLHIMTFTIIELSIMNRTLSAMARATIALRITTLSIRVSS